MTIPTLEPERIPPLKREFLRRMLGWYRPYVWRLVGAFALIILSTAFTVVQPLILRILVDRASSHSNFVQLAYVASLLVFLPVVGAVLGIFLRRILGVVSADMMLALRTKIYARLQHLPYRLYVHAPPGEINNRLNSDLFSTSQILQRAFPDGIGGVLRLVGTLVAMFAMEWRLALASLAVLPILGWLARRRNYQYRKLALASVQANSALSLQASETTQAWGVMNMRLFDRVHQEYERFRSLAKQARTAEIAQNNLMANNVISTSMIAAVGTAIVYAVGGLLVVTSGFTIGTVVAFAAYLGGLYASLQIIFSLQQGVALSLVAFERVLELFDLPEEDPGPVRNDLPSRASGALVFENVTFKFNDEIPLRATARAWSMQLMGLSSLEEPVPPTENALEEISFRVFPGKMLAVVGPSGAGKSTVFNLIPRFYDPDSGLITIDGENLVNLPLEWLRRQVGLVSQSIYILPGTLGENLRYARPEATEAEVEAALRAANLSEWVASLPHGLETYLGQSGARLSGGERQRLAIARALLKDTPILLLDEATSHLDSINESMLQDALFRVRQNRSTLVIAHRLSTVHDADEIIVLDHGRIMERGSHQQLLSHNALYTRLYEKQFVPEESRTKEGDS